MQTEAPQTLLIVDDHPLFRKGVIQLIMAVPEFRFIGEAPSGREGIELAYRLRPDMILLDLNMKDMSGIDVLKTLKDDGLDSRIIMLTVSDQAEDLMAALQAGADGYLLKDTEPEELLERVRGALEGRTVISDALTAALAGALRDDVRGERRDVRDLTDREVAVLRCVAGGQSNKVIARNLSITEGTVKVHVKHLLKKLGFRSRVEAAVWASQQGLRTAP